MLYFSRVKPFLLVVSVYHNTFSLRSKRTAVKRRHAYGSLCIFLFPINSHEDDISKPNNNHTHMYDVFNEFRKDKKNRSFPDGVSVVLRSGPKDGQIRELGMSRSIPPSLAGQLLCVACFVFLVLKLGCTHVASSFLTYVCSYSISIHSTFS